MQIEPGCLQQGRPTNLYMNISSQQCHVLMTTCKHRFINCSPSGTIPQASWLHAHIQPNIWVSSQCTADQRLRDYVIISQSMLHVSKISYKFITYLAVRAATCSPTPRKAASSSIDSSSQLCSRHSSHEQIGFL